MNVYRRYLLVCFVMNMWILQHHCASPLLCPTISAVCVVLVIFCILMMYHCEKYFLSNISFFLLWCLLIFLVFLHILCATFYTCW